eukprot:20422-Heterococcus_DN1.PRE.2
MEWRELLGDNVKMKARSKTWLHVSNILLCTPCASLVLLKVADTSELTSGFGPKPDVGHVVQFSYQVSTLLGQLVALKADAFARIGDGDVHCCTTPHSAIVLQTAKLLCSLLVDCTSGLELALRHMSSSQTCVVRCNSRFAYGERGLPPASLNGPAVPPDTDVDFEVTLERIVSTKSIADLTPEENLAEAHFKKSVGNEHFSAANYKLAVKCYQKAVNAVDSALPQLPAAARSVAQKLVVDCANNMVAAYLALDDLELAEQAVAVALQTDPNSVKGLYRAGQVSL